MDYPSNIYILSEKLNLKFEAFCGDQRTEQGLIKYAANMLQFSSAVKCYEAVYELKKAHLKTRNQGPPTLLLK